MIGASTSLPSNINAPIWSMSIEIHGKFLLGRLLLSIAQHVTAQSLPKESIHLRQSQVAKARGTRGKIGGGLQAQWS